MIFCPCYDYNIAILDKLFGLLTMAMRTDTVRAKVSHETKVGAELILNGLGLSMSDAINLMLIQVRIKKGLPFDISFPRELNEETKKVLEDSIKGKHLKTFTNTDELFKDLGI